MPIFGELYLSEILKKPVLDIRGEEIGVLQDLVVIKGETLPIVKDLIVTRKKETFRIPWQSMSLFSRRIMATTLMKSAIQESPPTEDELLAVRDILGKQIVDATGAKVVRANDIKLEGYEGKAVLVAIDTSRRGVLIRLGLEKRGRFLGLFKLPLARDLIGWNNIQPLTPKLKTISLIVPRQMVSELHPSDIAEIIRSLSHEEGTNLLNELDIETAAETLTELSPHIQAGIIEKMDAEKASDIIEEMPPDDAADILGDLPAEKAREILEKIEKEEAEDIQELLVHEEDTAGSVMTNEFIAYPPDLKIKDAIERFKQDAKEIETVYYIYVVDAEERLLGVTSLKEVLLADPLLHLSEIMETKIIKVSPDEDVEAVSDLMAKYNLVAIPVVDESGKMLGIITVDDIMDVMEDEATEDIYRLAGTSEVRFGKIEDASPFEIARKRLPWLLLCLLGGLISSAVISQYGSKISAFVILAPFIPVIMGMAGNAGLQVSATMVRSLALNTISSFLRYAVKEILSAFMIAIVTGVIIAIGAALMKHTPWVGMVVGVSMFLSISSSTLLALVTPATAERIGIDPAVVSGPFVTVFNDILGLTIYFSVASALLKYL